MILYLHGFCSSPASWKARLLAEIMEKRGQGDRLACPALSPAPLEAIAQAEAILHAAREPVTLVGSSLGGHYATWLAEQYGLPAVLLNPAVIQGRDLSHFFGEHANFHTGERFVFTAAHGHDLQSMIVAQPPVERLWLLVETGDEVLDYRQAVEYYRGCRQSILSGGDHSFTQFPEFVSQIIEFAGL